VEAFPFTDAEWDTLKPVAESILNASLAEDAVLAASLRLDMLELVGGLRERHGDHPVLLETAADYTEDRAERVALYRRAARIAEANGLPTLSIRTSLAFTLMALGHPAAALDELRACGKEAADGGEKERAWWGELLRDAADYAEGDAERPSLYRRAAEIAATHGLPTLRIRLCLARFLLDVGQPAAARDELRRCRSEVLEGGEDARAWWAELFAEAGRAEPVGAPDRGGMK
jgi:hypothetical protein